MAHPLSRRFMLTGGLAALAGPALAHPPKLGSESRLQAVRSLSAPNLVGHPRTQRSIHLLTPRATTHRRNRSNTSVNVPSFTFFASLPFARVR